MRSKIKSGLLKALQHDFIWKMMKPFAAAGRFIFNSRDIYERQLNDRKLAEQYLPYLGKDQNSVLHGFFAGLKYANLASVGSELFPKIIGSYEKELHATVESLCKTTYSDILNIGCAEGYYAVGLALKQPSARVYAYDIDPRALKLCREMAALNGVHERLVLSEKCTPETLAQFPFTGKALIVCDCEGYESVLFNEENISNLLGCDLLIETHDMMDVTISTRLYGLFKSTHHVETIKSIDDIEKAKTYRYPETDAFSLAIKKALFAERRPTIMEWLVCRSKT